MNPTATCDERSIKIAHEYEQIKKSMRGFPTVKSLEDIDQIDFKYMAELIDISEPTEVISHRPLVGGLLVFLKTTAMKLAQPLIKVLLRRQIELNEHLYYCAMTTQVLTRRIQHLEGELAKLRDDKGLP